MSQQLQQTRYERFSTRCFPAHSLFIPTHRNGPSDRSPSPFSCRTKSGSTNETTQEQQSSEDDDDDDDELEMAASELESAAEDEDDNEDEGEDEEDTVPTPSSPKSAKKSKSRRASAPRASRPAASPKVRWRSARCYLSRNVDQRRVSQTSHSRNMFGATLTLQARAGGSSRNVESKLEPLVRTVAGVAA